MEASGARLDDSDERARLQREMDALTEHARAADRRPETAPDRTARGGTRRKSLFVVIGIAVLVAALAAAAGTAIRSRPGTILSDVRSAAKSLLGVAEAPAPAEPAVTSRPAVKERSRGQRPSGTIRAALATDQGVGVSRTAPFAAALPRLSRLPLDMATVTIAPTRENPIFDSTDTEVSPALLVRPHLPSRSRMATPPARLGRLEVIVSATGKVERVRLLATTPERQFHDFMLLAAAKAWVFAPARREGVAVRYRLEISLVD